MKVRTLLTLTIVIGALGFVFAQNVELKEGSFNSLKAEKSIGIKVVFTKEVEEMYKDKHFMKDFNRDIYKKNFEILFTKYSLIECAEKSTPLTLLIEVTSINSGGYNYWSGGKNAFISYNIKLVKAVDDPSPLALAQIQNVPGRQPKVSFGANASNNNNEASLRISEGFSKAGKILGSYVASLK